MEGRELRLGHGSPRRVALRINLFVRSLLTLAAVTRAIPVEMTALKHTAACVIDNKEREKGRRGGGEVSLLPIF